MILVHADTETTGIEPGSRMVELAGVFQSEDGTLERFSTLINPGMPIPPDVVAIHGITDAMVADAPDTGMALQAFIDWLPREPVIVAHNAPYDVGVIEWESQRTGIGPLTFPVIDTLVVAKAFKATKNNKLGTLCEHYGIVVEGDAHRAAHDAEACRLYCTKIGIDASTPALTWSTVAGYGCPTGFAASEFECLPDLVRDGGSLAFSYTDAKGEATERSITPYGWAMTPRGMTFHGLCHLRGERRTFYAERASNVRPGQLLEASA